MMAGCVLGDNPRTVWVTAGDTTTVTLQIVCGLPFAAVRVTLTTTGAAPDADGYLLALDDAAPSPVGPNAVLDVGMSGGPHRLLLTGLAPFCYVLGPNPLTLTIDQPTSAAAFEIVCPGPPDPAPGRILYTVADDAGSRLFAMDADGSAPVELLPGMPAEGGRWSPDHTSIAFEGVVNGVAEIFTMDADASHLTPLGVGADPAWAPDGRRLVYVCGADLCIADVDGGAARTLGLSQNLWAPSWSPDGSAIVYAARDPSRCGLIYRFDPICGTSIYRVLSDGSGQHTLVVASGNYPLAGEPVYSPDGSRIAFAWTTWYGHANLFTMAADGSDPVMVPLNGAPTARAPVWSRDGASLLFAAAPAGSLDWDVARVPVSGGAPVTLRGGPGRQIPTSW